MFSHSMVSFCKQTNGEPLTNRNRQLNDTYGTPQQTDRRADSLKDGINFTLSFCTFRVQQTKVNWQTE